MKLVYAAVFYPCEESSGYTVVVPDLPGCVTEGKDLANAIEMAVDAASGWILDELEDGKTVPDPTPLSDVKPDESGFVSAIVLDMDSYAEKYGKKAARKNVTIPSWLNTRAEKENINFSQTLQDALMDRLGIISGRGA